MAEIIRHPSADARSVLTLIDGRPAIVLDEWSRSEQAGDKRIVPLATYLEARAELGARARVGLSVAGERDPGELVEALGGREALAAVGLIAIEVPKFTDGRHYSLARLLRERHGFPGDLRAFGDVLPDQLFYMRRCGYTSFELKAGKSLETGLRALQSFSVTYQGGADDPRPLYRRRA